MAYAAVKSLMQTILSHYKSSSRISSDSGATREILQSAFDHATSLEDALKRCSGSVTGEDEQIIIEESRKLEDVIEFPLSTHHFLEGSFDQLKKDVDCFAKAAMKMEANIEESWKQKVAKMIEESIMKLCVPKTENKPSPFPEEMEGSSSSSSSSMVGLCDEFLEIRNLLLTADECIEFFMLSDIITISGMAGIGKTLLAQKLVHDPSIRPSFDCRLFVRMGRDYVAYENEKKVMQGDYVDLDWKLVTHHSKCLIVLDDVQGELTFLHQLWGMIHDSKGIRILVMVTSRIDIDYGYNYRMRFLNEEESWELLRRNVFGEGQEVEDCPPELVKAGKKIAKECEGLPLLIIKVAPILLSKAQKNPEAWKRISEKPDLVLKEASHQISEVLLSNYHQLNEDRKLCFLYITAFPKKYVVWGTTIGYLWYSEGFHYGWNHARDYLYSLHVNNLVVGYQKDYWFKALYKACSLHCAYWYVCRREAENKKILYTINSLADGLDECIKSHRRLAIYTNVLLAIKEIHNSIASVAMVRSLLCTGPYHPYQVPMCWDWKLLRVLSALTIRFYEFPVEVVKLICLKYLGLTCNANLPPSISQLLNLQFLIVHQHSSIKRVGVESYLPVEIWDLQELEVLQIIGRNLPDPPLPGAVLPNLTKLLDVGIESCTKGVLESLPWLKKLRVQIELVPNVAETMSFFDHLSYLDSIRSFQSVVMNPALILHPPPPLSFHMSNLESLSLSGFGYPWEDMSNIAQLEQLITLKLKCYAFRGEKWEGEGMSFKNLKFLYIEDTDLMQWTAEDETFPELSRLTMINCHKVKEIPLFSTEYGVQIELLDCNPSVETCTKERYSAHSKSFNLTATYSWNL